jgi:predicted esterase
MKPIPLLVIAWIALALIATSARAQDDVADVPAQDLTVETNPKQRYFLIGPDAGAEAPEKGYSLLLVLPGGDGSAEFNPFIRRIYRDALPEKKYLVAQLVAVESTNPRQVVWPTARSKDPKQAFSTESFIINVIKEIKAKHAINEAEIFTLSWSSGGPAAYAASMTKGTPIKGSLVAMSVFFPGQLNLPAAKGQKYFLLQSPQDQMTKYVHATNAKKALEKAGATVTLKDYEGGHGWRGNVFGNIREGIEWLERTAPPTP